MKKLFVLSIYFLLSFSILIAQEFPCLTHVREDTSSVPRFLRTGWGQTKTAKVVVVYIDFPDGRWNDNGVLKQPLDTAQLRMVENKDAVGEIGLSTDVNHFYVGYNSATHLDLYMKPAKYSWQDRWNMFFSTNGSYNGTAHPDCYSNGDSAYGSFYEYWNEVSNSKYIIIPDTTHPNAPTYELKTGILNNYIQLPDERYIINNLTLPLKKYGLDSTIAYFPNTYRYSFWTVSIWNKDVSRINLMLEDCLQAVKDSFPNFQVENFMNQGGTVIFVMAGSHNSFKGKGSDGKNFTLVRGRTDKIDTSSAESRIDGFGVTAHEFAHVTPNLKWGHSNAGRYCIMNLYDVHDKNCPQHPAPNLKVMQGWLTPIPLEYSQTSVVIPPIETSHQCGILTVYGKPTASPDKTSGEYYILENRRRLGFDRKIISKENLPLNPDDFAGGLLIWHYSPYNTVKPDSIKEEVYTNIQLRTPEYDSVNFISTNGDPKHFFAWKSNLQYFYYYNYDTNRTFSSFKLKTDLFIKNISNDYNNFSGNISLDINYYLGDPPNYNFVLYGQSFEHDTTFSGNVYVHSTANFKNLNINPGATIDYATNSLYFNGNSTNQFVIKASGQENNPILFRGAGYVNLRISALLYSLYIQENDNPSTDTNIFKYCLFDKTAGAIKILSANSNTPLVIENLSITDTSKYLEIAGPTSPNSSDYELISKYSNNDCNLFLDGRIKFDIANDLIINQNKKLNIINTGGVRSSCVLNFLNSNKIYLNGISTISGKLTINRDFYISNTGKIMFPLTQYSTLVKFSPGYGINCVGEFYADGYQSSNYGVTFDRDGESGYWNGINCYNSSSFYMKGANVKNASTGIQISHGSPSINITNSNFSGNNYSDIYLDQITNINVAPLNVSQNTLNDSLIQVCGLGCNEISNSKIDSNNFNNVYSIGLYLSHTSDLKASNNHIFASIGQAAPTAGIYSYFSDAFLSCNEITNFYDGILFDNSSPYLLNNEIYNNGIGLYLANSSNPILSPSYSQYQGLYNAGYNRIYNNSNQEIYCANSFGFSKSLPYLDIGYNSIYDSSGGALITTNLDLNDPKLYAQYNFWGQVPNVEMFVPAYSVFDSNYLTRQPDYSSCSPELMSQNNENLSQSILLFGNSNINDYTKNYSSAINGYTQIISSNNNVLSNLVSSKLYYTYLKSGSSFSELASYYNNIASQHTGDTAFFKHLINLMIGSHIKEPLYQQAINEYQYIINNSQNQDEIYYATIEKVRTIELMLDSLINHHGGDNTGMNNYTNQELTGLIKGFFDNDFSKNRPQSKFENSNKLSRQNENKKKSGNKNRYAKDNSVKQSNQNDDVKKTKSVDNNKNQFTKISSKTNDLNIKQKSINDLKKNIPINNINLNNLKNPELIKLLDRLITIKLIEKSLLNYTPDNRPLVRIKPDRNGKTNKNEGLINLPKEYKLSQNYPNPFNPMTKINYDLPKDGKIKLVIYDILGREVKTLVDEIKQAGSYIVEFNGSQYASGVYFYRLVSGNYVSVKRMVLIK